MKQFNYFKNITIGTFLTWLLVFGLLPFLFVLMVSFMQSDPATILNFHFTLSHYFTIFQKAYLWIFLKSFLMAGVCTLICLVLAYPFAYFLANIQSRMKHILLVFLIIPFWTNSVVRAYAIIILIKTHGVINTFLLHLGIIHHPLQLLFTNTAVIIGLVYNLLPFMILPLYANLERFDHNLFEAAKDLGASNRILFFKILLPLSMSGIIAGCILVFFPAMTIFYIPDILGGAKSMLLGNLIENQFLVTQNWPLGAAISISLTIMMGLMLLIYWRYANGQEHQELL